MQESDMILMLNLNTNLVIAPFCRNCTVIVRCDVLDPNNKIKFYDKDSRSIAKHAEVYLNKSGIAEFSRFGPELEFFIC